MSLADSGTLTDEGTHGGSDSDYEDTDDSHIFMFQTTPKGTQKSNNFCANRDFTTLPDFEKETELDDYMNTNLLSLLNHGQSSSSYEKKASFVGGHLAPTMSSHQEEVYSHSFCAPTHEQNHQNNIQ